METIEHLTMTDPDDESLKPEKIAVLKDAFERHLPEDVPEILWEALASCMTIEHFEKGHYAKNIQDYHKVYDKVHFVRTPGGIVHVEDEDCSIDPNARIRHLVMGIHIYNLGTSATEEVEQLVEELGRHTKTHHWKGLCRILQVNPRKSTTSIDVKSTGASKTLECWVLERQRLLPLLANAQYIDVLVKFLVHPIARYNQHQHLAKQHAGFFKTPPADNDPLRLLPDWAQSDFDTLMKRKGAKDDTSRIRHAIDLSQTNVEHAQEPFACVIYQHNKTSNTTIPYILGVNRNELHAETMALKLLTARMENDKASNDMEYWMYSSCEPCCDCFGTLVLLLATLKATTEHCGITKLCTAATKGDAESLGFDEGPIFPESYDALQQVFGIQVPREMERETSANIIRAFGESMNQDHDSRFYAYHLDKTSLDDIAKSFHTDGFVVLRQALDKMVLQEPWAPYANECFAKVFEILYCNDYIEEETDRRQGTDNYTMGLGLKNGFAEVVMRSLGRYEISLMHLLHGNETRRYPKLPRLPSMPGALLEPIQSLLPLLLGKGAEMKLIHLSLLVARPGSTDQAWHADGPHATTSSSTDTLPCHVFNIFIPLQDTPHKMGPTELRPGSHHLTKGNLAKNMLVAKCKKTLHPPEWPQLQLGDVLIFDYRVLHRGRANQLDKNRSYLVMTYAEPWFQDKLNFPKRSMYERNPKHEEDTAFF